MSEAKNTANPDAPKQSETEEPIPKKPVSILKVNVAIAQQPPEPAHPTHPTKPAKKKRRDRSDLGENFVAPDGGWGWVVAFASGISILVSLAMAQQFGIIFRERFKQLGLTSSQLTTIVNTQISVSSFTGLVNGPIFRRFTYRQVGLAGSVLTFIGLFLLVFADSFLFFIVTYSVLYGVGRGLTLSACALAVNTYFKQKRRTATAYQFGVAGLGPIVLPYLATYLLIYFGVQGTVLIFSGLALHTIACSLIFQPVLWHVKKVNAEDMPPEPVKVEEIIEYPIEPETPTLPRANDGWYGSRSSLSTPLYKRPLSTRDMNEEFRSQVHELKRLNSGESTKRGGRSPHSIEEEDPIDYEKDYEEKIRSANSAREALMLQQKAEKELDQLEDVKRKRLPFYMKIAIFFDLDLLKDITYVNLAVGLTLINFIELNFAILTPFILSDFGFNNSQIALAMSTLGLCDLIIRFLIPLITGNLKMGNKALFIVGIAGMCIGRALLAYTRDMYTLMAIFIWMGLCKAFRTVFWGLIIPSYVPLKRLPAAAGLQLLMAGFFALGFGPLIGLIRDNTNYVVTLNVLNAICIFAIFLWVLEAVIRKINNNPLKI